MPPPALPRPLSFAIDLGVLHEVHRVDEEIPSPKNTKEKEPNAT